MTFTTLEVVGAVRGLLEGAGGLAESVESLKSAYGRDPVRPGPAPVIFLRASPEMPEKAWGARYPVIHIYCDRIESRPTEKLRRFSGKARVMVDVRVSQDRLDGITEELHLYADAVRDVVERKAGCVGEGLYLSSEYEVGIEPVKKGGANYLQTAKIGCTVIVNRT